MTDLPENPSIGAAPAPQTVGEPQPGGGKPAESASPAPRSPAPGEVLIATGRRKQAVARVRLMPGNGAMLVNRKSYEQYFPRETLRLAIRSPLLQTHHLGKLNVVANVAGGGLAGQAGAIRLGIARALVRFDPALRSSLRSAGFLTRDPREKERKKYGQKGARKRFQWTKR